jgi:ATP-binding cassette, subfamily B, bacterial
MNPPAPLLATLTVSRFAEAASDDPTFRQYLWPIARLGEGMAELARRAHLQPLAGDALVAPESVLQGKASDLARWIEWAGNRLGIEAEAVEGTVSGFAQLAANAGPALFHFTRDGAPCFLLLLKSSFGALRLIGADLKLYRCPVERLRVALCHDYEAPLTHEIDRLLEAAKLPRRRWPKVRQVMLNERIGAKTIGHCWLLRLSPSTGFWRQLTLARLPRRLGWVLGMFAAVYSLELSSWGLIGNAALNGQLDMGWMAAWVLLVLSLVPLRLIGNWLNSTFALDASRILKKRLLAGALRLDLESVRHKGAGQLLSRVMESQALESLAVNGGLSVIVAVLELIFAASVLAVGAGGLLHVALLLGWLVVTVWWSLRYIGRMQRWTLMRLDMTHRLVERMIGHRTSLAQERPMRRDAREDRLVDDYQQLSKHMDKSIIPVVAGIPSGWMLIGIFGLAPAFVSDSGSSVALAIGFGGVMLANRALGGISGGLASIASALISWRQVGPLFHAATGAISKEPFLSAAQIDGAGPDRQAKIIDASSLVFRYRPEGDAVLRDVDLTIYRGERILLEGSSGGGKSTLAALLVGLRTPESGLLLLNGLDHHTLGEGWHRLATEAPQFHENHILTGTLGFNLLMGRNWPASEEDLEEARQICIELGLGDLLGRMPSGMMQMVGETGWQLSHGERSRIFLARALLQESQLTIMDESFAALDPETLEQCLNCAFKRARTLMVVAHP